MHEDREAATARLADAFRIEVGGLGLDELVERVRASAGECGMSNRKKVDRLLKHPRSCEAT